MRYRDHRHPCDTEVGALLGEEMRRVRLVNVSASGARVEGMGRLPRDALVTLTWLTARLRARVAWSNDRQAGLRFLVPLSSGDVDALRREKGRGPGGWSAVGHRAYRELT